MPNNTRTLLTSLKYLFLTFILVIGLVSITASGGGGSDDSSSTEDTTDDTTDDTTNTSQYNPNNLPSGQFFTDTAYNLAGATEIQLNTSSISITGTGASAVGPVATITSPGTYHIYGTLTDGQLIVDTLDAGDISLYLNSADITCTDGPSIYIKNAERVIVALADGTVNSLTDGSSYATIDEDGEPDAALFSHEDLVIYGAGTLTVNAKYRDGIKSKDGLIIHSGTIIVNSTDDGISGKNYVSVEDGDITIDAGGDGMKAANEGDADQGYIYINDGYFEIVAGTDGSGDGIQAETHIVIKGGTFDLITAGGSTSKLNLDEVTAKGFKANIGVTIDGGTFIVDSADDSFHSDDTIVINGGNLDDIASADDAMHAELALTVNNAGTIINVTTCYEGIESMVITINDGSIHVRATNDPINASDGSGTGMMPMQPGGGGGMPPGGTSNNCALYINGGYMALYNINTTDSDGFDSNGSIVMTGGIVIINGGFGQNGIMDYGSFAMNGGFIIGAGTSSMPQAAGDASSTQKSFFETFDSNTGKAGTLIHVRRSDGVNVVTFAPSINFQAIEFSSPLLLSDSSYTYTVYTGGNYSPDTDNDGLYGNIDDNVYTDDGTYTIGTEVSSGPLSSYAVTGGGMFPF
ncbi:MAG: carbohydrate-binding domain-containing protein [Deltaproteobacteria bacterium]|nr:carbohydrate-binding domain-containing protein [Deltaproteobacteria bacterium]